MVVNTTGTQTVEQGPASHAHRLVAGSDRSSLLSLTPVRFSTWQPFIRRRGNSRAEKFGRWLLAMLGWLSRTSELRSLLSCWPWLPGCKMGMFLAHYSAMITAFGQEVVDLARKELSL